MSLETIEAGVVDYVVIKTKMTAICPLTNTTDIYELTLTYKPKDGRYLELASFKKYVEKFREVKVFHEDLAQLIAEDVCKSISPLQLIVMLRSSFMDMDVTVVKKTSCS